MFDLGGSGDDSQDDNFLGKSGAAESESSSEKGVAVGANPKAPTNVQQHSVKKSAAATPSVSTFRYPLNSPQSGTDDGSVASKKKPKSRRK